MYAVSNQNFVTGLINSPIALGDSKKPTNSLPIIFLYRASRLNGIALAKYPKLMKLGAPAFAVYGKNIHVFLEKKGTSIMNKMFTTLSEQQGSNSNYIANYYTAVIKSVLSKITTSLRLLGGVL